MNDYSLELQEQMMNQLEEMQTKIESYKQYSMLRSHGASGTISFEDERSTGRVKTAARKRKLEREEDEQLDF